RRPPAGEVKKSPLSGKAPQNFDFRIAADPAILVTFVNNRKEVIQCLIVNRRGRRHRTGSSPLTRSTPRDAKRPRPKLDHGTTMEGLPGGRPFLHSRNAIRPGPAVPAHNADGRG